MSNSDNSNDESKLRPPKFISLSLIIGKFGCFKGVITVVLMKISIVANGLKKLRKINNYNCKQL